jgi:hypothetical protein
MSAIILGAIKLIGAILFVPAVKMFPRRLLLCTSAFIMGISMMVLAIVLHSREAGSSIGNKFEGGWGQLGRV